MPRGDDPIANLNKSDAGSLGLGIPKREPISKGHFLLSTKQAEAWLATLPMANVGETARQTYLALLDLTHKDIPHKIRPQVVELFREPVDYLSHNLRRHYTQMGLPLSSKAQKTVRLSSELNAELANAYKIMIEDMVSGRNPNFDRELLVISLHRALFYLGRIMLEAALAYMPVAGTIWKEIHVLYNYAAQNRVHLVPVKLTFDGQQQIHTIEESYKHLLLFASAEPQRLSQQHIIQLYRSSSGWSRYLEFDNGEEVAGRRYLYHVNLQSNNGPAFNAPDAPVTAPTRSARLQLDFSRILKHLRNQYEEAHWEDGLTSNQADKLLLRTLLKHWLRSGKRKHPRTQLNFELNMVCGLHTIDRHLRERETSDETNDPSPDSCSVPSSSLLPADSESNLDSLTLLQLAELEEGLDSLTLADMDEPHQKAPQKTQYGLSSLSYLIPSAKLAPDHPSAEPEPEPEVDDGDTTAASTVSESAGGYCIAWPAESDRQIKVGELIAIASPTSNRYSLSSVRWISAAPNQPMLVGIRLMAPYIKTVDLVRPRNGSQTSEQDLPSICLLLYSHERQENTDSGQLLVNNTKLNTATELWLKNGGKDRLIRIGKRMEYNSLYARYRFSFATRQSQTTGGNNDATDFDDLWKSL